MPASGRFQTYSAHTKTLEAGHYYTLSALAGTTQRGLGSKTNYGCRL